MQLAYFSILKMMVVVKKSSSTAPQSAGSLSNSTELKQYQSADSPFQSCSLIITLSQSAELLSHKWSSIPISESLLPNQLITYLPNQLIPCWYQLIPYPYQLITYPNQLILSQSADPPVFLSTDPLCWISWTFIPKSCSKKIMLSLCSFLLYIIHIKHYR
jgi:hypothetical protein